MDDHKYLYQLYDLAHAKGVIVEQVIGEDEYIIVQPRTGLRLSPWIRGVPEAIKWIEEYEGNEEPRA